MHNYNNHNGFTLIELSIVLIVLGMLVALGGGIIGPLTNFIKVRETRDIQDSATQSIISWASSKNSIPTASGFPTAAKSSKDAWGREFVYRYYSSISTSSPTKDTICGLRSTTLTLQTTDPPATMPNVALVILSGAENATLKSTLNGTLITTSGNATGTITVTGPNGDLVRWVTLDELRSKIGCQGAPLKIINNELPYANYSANYSATITADGGSGSGKYQWRIKKGNLASPVNATFFNSSTGSSRALPFINISTTDWSASATSLSFEGYPKLPGSYFFSIFVRDNIGNSSSKPFVLTVNPR
jgi:prepilin-type N-terminal cleavage/methylation domain-containing protein